MKLNQIGLVYYTKKVDDCPILKKNKKFSVDSFILHMSYIIFHFMIYLMQKNRTPSYRCPVKNSKFLFDESIVSIFFKFVNYNLYFS